MATPLITASQARRISLASQYLHTRRPESVSSRHIGRVLGRLNVVQIDSVNVLARAHLMPLYSRLGPYPVETFEKRWQNAPRGWVEYWAHEASLVPAELRPSLVALQRRAWMRAHDMDGDRREDITAQVLDQLATARPMTSRQLEQRVEAGDKKSGNWGWNWSEVKRVLEDQFAVGTVTSAGRTKSFERRYALPSRVLPDDAHTEELPAPEESVLRLVRAAAPALGVATVASLADYYRIRQGAVAEAVDVLAGTGELEPVRLQTVTGGERPAWRYAGISTPRRAQGRALLNPFDPQVFHRPRVEDLFGVRYRIGIYTPAKDRRRGYYPLLFLLGEHMVAQVDLAAERAASRLSIRGAWLEAVPSTAGPTTAEIAAELAEELTELAEFLNLSEITVTDEAPGDLVPAVERALRELPGNRP